MAEYQVSDTREVSTLTPTGHERKYFRVWILTEHGATGSVDVEPGNWKKDTLAAILQEKADELELAYTL